MKNKILRSVLNTLLVLPAAFFLFTGFRWLGAPDNAAGALLMPLLSGSGLGSQMGDIGGMFLASRVNSVDPNTGANDTLLLAVGAAVIGGTSLFGGEGRVLNAVLGGFVLALIPNGLTLVGTQEMPWGQEIDFGSSGIKFMCAGAALLVASSVDALSRKRATT